MIKLSWQKVRTILIENHFKIGHWDNKRPVCPVLIGGKIWVSKYTSDSVRVDIESRYISEDELIFIKTQIYDCLKNYFNVSIQKTWLVIEEKTK